MEEKKMGVQMQTRQMKVVVAGNGVPDCDACEFSPINSIWSEHCVWPDGRRPTVCLLRNHSGE